MGGGNEYDSSGYIGSKIDRVYWVCCWEVEGRIFVKIDRMRLIGFRRLGRAVLEEMMFKDKWMGLFSIWNGSIYRFLCEICVLA